MKPALVFIEEKEKRAGNLKGKRRESYVETVSKWFIRVVFVFGKIEGENGEGEKSEETERADSTIIPNKKCPK
ncbi:MAG: hypothetical protein AAB316_10970 [Bacteroidota bacterium]